MVQANAQAEGTLRESQSAEQALIDAEEDAERALLAVEARLQKAMRKLERAQERVESRQRALEQARARLDQCQLERAAGPLIRRAAVARPALPRPARDDSRARAISKQRLEPSPLDDGSNDNGAS